MKKTKKRSKSLRGITRPAIATGVLKLTAPVGRANRHPFLTTLSAPSLARRPPNQIITSNQKYLNPENQKHKKLLGKSLHGTSKHPDGFGRIFTEPCCGNWSLEAAIIVKARPIIYLD